MLALMTVSHSLYLQLWSFTISGLLWMFAFSSFNSLVINFATSIMDVSEFNATHGYLIAGFLSVVGILAVCLTARLDYSKYMLQGILHFCFGTALLLMALIEDEVSVLCIEY